MSLPAISKPWQIVPNMPSYNIPSVGGRGFLLDRKNALKGTAFGSFQITQNAWTVVRSSNGVTVADSDLWITTGDLVLGNDAGTDARSWIVLRNPVTKRQVLWDFRGSTSRHAYLTYSPSVGFTGGTTTSPPTASDQLPGWSQDFCSAGVCNQHIWHSADGRQTMAGTCLAGSPGTAAALWMVGELEDAPSSWANPMVAWDGTTGDHGTPTVVTAREMIGFSGSHPFAGEALPGVNGTIRAITEAVGATNPLINSGSGISLRNELSDQWDIFEKMWFQGEHVNLWGPLGYWPDMYPTYHSRTSAPAFLTGDNFPGDGSRLWVKFDDLVLPWQGCPVMVKGS